jgi:hypothetical protein
MKNKETLEEAAERYADKIWDFSNSNEKTLHTNCNKAFLKGAKWQQQNSYSEEDMQDFAKFCLLCKDEQLPYIFPKDWLKHIKNKIK